MAASQTCARNLMLIQAMWSAANVETEQIARVKAGGFNLSAYFLKHAMTGLTSEAN